MIARPIQCMEYLGTDSFFPFLIDAHMMSSPELIFLSVTR